MQPEVDVEAIGYELQSVGDVGDTYTHSPVGPVRFVVGYNPYSRPAGPLYYEVPGGAPTDELGSPAGSLPCLSFDPANPLLVHRADDGTLRQNEGVCPRNFKPRTSRGLGSRLTFSLAIGQAF